MIEQNAEETKFYRHGFGLKREIQPTIEAEYKSSLIEEIKANGFRLTAGRLTFKLAQEFGFCYGVDKAVDFSLQTQKRFPDRRIFITDEIIHNPLVNLKLLEMGIQFLKGQYRSAASFEGLTSEDVVLLPAFGTTVEELAILRAKGCVLVDTTCGSVIAVWKRVEKYAREGFTAVVHGKYDHEETQATCSRTREFGEGKYWVVRDLEQAEKVCQYIVQGGGKAEFMKQFAHAASSGFDPDRDLVKIGCANQTTMLASESLEIANRFQEAMAARYGREHLAEHFQHFDTICGATQDRQDAIGKLIQNGVDLMIVIGGYNSSNTGHLSEMASEHCPAYHVKDASCISTDRIEYKPAGSHKIQVQSDWLPLGELRIGVTAGASTPNRVIESVILKIIDCADAERVEPSVQR